MINLLWMGDSPSCNTGFGVVASSVLSRLYLTKEYNLNVIGINHDAANPHKYEGSIRIFPAASRGNVYGINRIGEVFDKVQPDVLIFNNDVWVIGMYLRELEDHLTKRYKEKKNWPKFKIITYSPVDAWPMQPGWLSIYEKMKVSRVVAYTEYGKMGLWQANKNLPYDIIGHGIDINDFYPIDDATDFFDNLRNGSFIIQNVNRNQPRKRLDLFMKVVGEWTKQLDQKDRDRIKIYYHGVLKDMGYDLQELALRYGLDKSFLYSNQNINAAQGVSVEVLNRIYNLASVHMNTGMGEGWGLTSFESGACGVAQIVPAHSACKELWEGVAELINISHYDTLVGGINTEGAVIDTNHAIEILDTLYRNPDKLKEMGQEAYKFVKNPKFSWDYVAQRFHTVIKEVLEDKNG